jgi:hypothetical protein
MYPAPVRRPSQPLCGIVLVVTLALLLTACGGGDSKLPEAPPDSLHVSCLTKPDRGPCRAAKPAYFYDYASDSCQQFLWGGCEGRVPFETLDACLRMCKGGG